MKSRARSSPTDSVQARILSIRGQKVILDADLAAIYGVTTKRLNEQVKRNSRRFPTDFMFQLTREEFFNLRSNTAPDPDMDSESPPRNRSQLATGSEQLSKPKGHGNLRSQFATSSFGYGGPRYFPYAFTENGAVMAANVLNSPDAVRLSIHVVRAFIQMRALLSGSTELAAELRELEAKLTARLDGHETAIVDVLQRIMLLLDPPPSPAVPKKEMGFHTTLAKPQKG